MRFDVSTLENTRGPSLQLRLLKNSASSKITPSSQDDSHLRTYQVGYTEVILCSNGTSLKNQHSPRALSGSCKTVCRPALLLLFHLFPPLLLLPASHRCWSQEQPLINTLPAKLHIRVCFLGNPICDLYSLTFYFFIC